VLPDGARQRAGSALAQQEKIHGGLPISGTGLSIIQHGRWMIRSSSTLIVVRPRQHAISFAACGVGELSIEGDEGER
jgi:hypothetical protein